MDRWKAVDAVLFLLAVCDDWVAGVPNTTVVLKSGVVSGTGHGRGGEGSAKQQSACVVFHTVATCTGKHAFIRIEKGSDGKADKFTIQDNRCAHGAMQSMTIAH